MRPAKHYVIVMVNSVAWLCCCRVVQRPEEILDLVVCLGGEEPESHGRVDVEQQQDGGRQRPDTIHADEPRRDGRREHLFIHE
jgi:hypothetical protein